VALLADERMGFMMEQLVWMVPLCGGDGSSGPGVIGGWVTEEVVAGGARAGFAFREVGCITVDMKGHAAGCVVDIRFKR
jgi:hypothetical protein